MLVKLNQATTQNGFTLIEVLTVMLVLVAIASVTIEVSSDLAFQNRYEVTKDRYEKIKRAIIGRPDVLINGQPDISGFVADMGRLPRNLQELLVQNYCSDDYRISDNTPNNTGIAGATGVTPEEWCTSETGTPGGIWLSTSCTDPTKTTQALCTGAGGVWNAWNGPYLAIQKPDYEPNAISDGWGNAASPTDFTDHNYGWLFCLGNSPDISTPSTCYSPTNTGVGTNQLAFQSKGKDGSIGGTATYESDYPASITVTTPSIKLIDWQVDIATLQAIVSTQNHGECLSAVCSDPIYSLYANCIQQRAVWRVGVCSVDPSINTDITSCSGASGTWTELGSCSNSSYTTKASCEANSAIWTGICSNSNYTTLASCEQSRGTWFGCSINPDTDLTKSICTGTWTSAIEQNCQKGGGLWQNNKNLCIRVSRNSTVTYSNANSIIEDNENHIITYGAANSIPFGNSTISIHPSDDATCDANDDDVTYPSVCLNSSSHANFTQNNCISNGGNWIAGATPAENICANMNTGANGILCTGTTAPELGGVWLNKAFLDLKLIPNTTLPTINW